jgi:methylphosphotriester-DNA--protein-cysteine methyltransferase
MAGNWGEPERMWDEYDWERFLQQQDGKTEKYMQLLETYLDDPRRDEIIAREMGWTQLLDEKDWSAEVDALLDETASEDEESDVDNTAASGETFQDHNLYRAAFDLTLWIDQLFDQNATLQNEPASVKLATHAALASAKLAAALSGDHLDEIGMTIAYLKRALKAITTSMNAAAQLRKSAGLISRSEYLVLQQRLFEVRDGIVSLMGEYRGEWRRRFGPDNFQC